MAKKRNKIKFSASAIVATFLMDVGDKEHEFEFKELSSKELVEVETTLEAQHEAMRENTTCVTEGLTEKEAEAVVDELFEAIWENVGAGRWMDNMREIVGNEKKKK